ncbi:hypothetical protein F9K33_13810 [bacterium]|nr:MAG: hypothetical protein F9K33_13810 [bacterium]MBL7958695.1 hypothetical protein [bacterium]
MKANQKQIKGRPRKAPAGVSDTAWIKANWDMISKHYAGQWIAVFHESVIANGHNPEIVHLNAKEIVGDVTFTVKYIEKGIVFL